VFLFAICIVGFFSDGNFAQGGVPVLEWDPNPEPTIAGYNVYSGNSSGNYTHVVDVGLQTSVPLTNLMAGATYFFAVTAYDTSRLESPFSDEVWYTPRVDGESAVLLPFIFVRSANALTIRFSGQTDQQCWVLASSDLLQWEPVYSVTFPEDNIAEYVEVGRRMKPMRFYRVIGGRP